MAAPLNPFAQDEQFQYRPNQGDGGDFSQQRGLPVTVPEAPMAIGPTTSTQLSDGSKQITFEDAAAKGGPKTGPAPTDPDANLADWLPDSVKDSWCQELIEGVEADEGSASEWREQLKEGLKLLGLETKEQTDMEKPPQLMHPMLLEANLRFQATGMGEMMPAGGPVKTDTLGPAPEADEQAAERVRVAMNYFLTKTADEYYPDHDRMLWHVGLIGCSFKKIFTDPVRRRPVAPFLLPQDVIVSYGASSLQTAARVTNRIPMRKSELRRFQLSGYFTDMDLGQPYDRSDDIEEAAAAIVGRTPVWVQGQDEPHTIMESCCERELDPIYLKQLGIEAPPGLALPWIVTYEHDSQKVIRIARHWKPNDSYFNRRRLYVKYGFVPGPGFYDLGLIHIGGNSAYGASLLLQQTIHAGQFHSFPGLVGTKNIQGDDLAKTNIRIGPGQIARIETAGQPIRDTVMAIPYNEPSQVMTVMLEGIIQAGQRVLGTADLPVGEGRQDAPVGTTLALIEQATKVIAASHKRQFVTLGDELVMIRDELARNPAATYDFEIDGKQQQVTGADFKNVRVIPVADPNIPSTVQRLARADVLARETTQNPDLVDRRKSFIRRMHMMAFPDIEAIMNPEPAQAVPMDPVSENMAVMKNQPIKAGIEQDHASHIPVHLAYLHMPLVASAPHAPEAIMAHVAEHIALWYRAQMMAQLGVDLPPAGQPMDPKLEAELARRMVAASQAIHEQLQTQGMGSGVTKEQLQMMDIQVKLAELQRKREQTTIENQVQLSVAQLEAANRAADRQSTELVARIGAASRGKSK